MGDPRGFLKHDRVLPERRPVPVRLRDWREVYEPFPEDDLRKQASRCMDCGIPFCNDRCPPGNLTPAWTDPRHRDHRRLGGARGGHEHVMFGLAIGITHIDLQEEPVQLRFRQGIGAFLFQGVLRRQNVERLGQGLGLAGDGDGMFLHGLQQG